MFEVFAGFVALALGFALLFRKAKPSESGDTARRKFFRAMASRFGGVVLTLVGLFLLAGSSFIFINADKVGHLKRIYAFEELPPGRIIALQGQKGPQARILGPGFHFIPLIRVLYDVEQYRVINVPEGYYGEITARDGKPMPEGMFIAPAFADDRVTQMLNADIFLTEGGIRGPQETVLKPGSYRLNRYLFNVEVTKNTNATIIPAGHVGVVKSNVANEGKDCSHQEVKAVASGALSVPLVDRGCIGIWKEPLLPGAYYLNHKAYEVTLVDTRVQTWIYSGGYVKRIIDLHVDQQGNIKQTERSETQQMPQNAADRAVFVKIEGWDIPLDLRALVQVPPENAPVLVGSVGGITEIENRILTPAIRSIVRNVAGSQIRVPVVDDKGVPVQPMTFTRRPTRVLDLIEHRDFIEETIESKIKIEGRKAGVEIKEIRLGEPSIPPELLISRLRVQLADQLGKAYERETSAQAKRVETEQARATANEQPRLVAAQIAVKVAKQREAERAALGSAERKFLEELAKGQNAQASVLGKDRVAMLQALDKVLGTLESKPELVGLVSRLVPHTVVGGDGGGLTGAAAILGSALSGKTPEKPAQ
ncbi:MAG: hypothetical protein C0605_05110 [Hyphomicrobiales bacterium]|nr:MAG: hypothetical protein C0605_05110 [Hyphomicrobiales bacterium]